jgi:hypothetical protein
MGEERKVTTPTRWARSRRPQSFFLNRSGGISQASVTDGIVKHELKAQNTTLDLPVDITITPGVSRVRLP